MCLMRVPPQCSYGTWAIAAIQPGKAMLAIFPKPTLFLPPPPLDAVGAHRPEARAGGWSPVCESRPQHPGRSIPGHSIPATASRPQHFDHSISTTASRPQHPGPRQGPLQHRGHGQLREPRRAGQLCPTVRCPQLPAHPFPLLSFPPLPSHWEGHAVK